MERTDVTRIWDVIRLGETSLSQRDIAQATNTSVATVSRVLVRAREAGLSWPLPETMSAADLHAVIYPAQEEETGRLEPDWERIAAQIGRSRVPRAQLYSEYCNDAGAQGQTACSRSRFFALLKDNCDGRGAKPEMRFEHQPEQKFLSDFSGTAGDGSISTRSGGLNGISCITLRDGVGAFGLSRAFDQCPAAHRCRYLPDPESGILRVRFVGFGQAAGKRRLVPLVEGLRDTRTICPGTNLRMVNESPGTRSP